MKHAGLKTAEQYPGMTSSGNKLPP